MNALLASKACDLTGVIAIACARHGCFVPNALVDMFKGEQQKNTDFSLLRAIAMLNISPEQGVLLIYDIICQYIVHLLERIGDQLPPGMTIDRAIDLFHVHAHKDECFFRYALTFIPGAGVVAGQILESLWSSLNSVSPMARTATLPHRAEILDDHTCDSNNKKLLAMTETIRTRYLDALQMVKQADDYYLEITGTITQLSKENWEREVLEAEKRRLEDIRSMDIYAARLPNQLTVDPSEASVPAPANTPIEKWIEYALMVEEKQ